MPNPQPATLGAQPQVVLPYLMRIPPSLPLRVPSQGVLPPHADIPQPATGATKRSWPTSCEPASTAVASQGFLPLLMPLPLTGAAKVILAYLMPNPQTCTAAPRPSVHAYSAEYPSLPTGGAAKGPDLTSCRIPSLPLRSSQGSCPTSCPYSPSLPLSAAARGPAYLMPMPQPAPRVQPRGPAYLIANPPDLPTGASQRVLALLMHRTPQPATGVPAKAVPAPPHCRIPKALPLSSTKGSMPTVIA
ncbi:extensin-like [Pomacea canaliculata]|uniref:extensin-like n=1 Tax=Pomacea canaliculata TaxID=400727 RepID=UPI000D737F64|nr:extensin-like [Pomacea canaliculata]